MKRKTFLNRLALGSTSLVLLPTTGLLQGCEYKPVLRTTLTEADLPFLNTLAETILPATESSPGAKEANVGEYILLMYQDCMEEDGQLIFLDGLNELDNRSVKVFSGSFLHADETQRLSLLETIQTEAIAHNEELEAAEALLEEKTPIGEKFHNRESKNTEKPKPHYFDMLKGLTISGYFTSEIGMTEAREYLPVPGKFEACIPYSKDDKVWAI